MVILRNFLQNSAVPFLFQDFVILLGPLWHRTHLHNFGFSGHILLRRSSSRKTNSILSNKGVPRTHNIKVEFQT